MTAQEPSPECPRCRTNEYVIPLLYSLSGTPDISQVLAGGAFLGGCIVHPGSPKWHCTNCGTDFGHVEEESARA